MVHQKERESYPQRVGLAILVVVPTVHFGVGSVLAVAAAALGRSLTAAVVASNLGQWSITFATTRNPLWAVSAEVADTR